MRYSNFILKKIHRNWYHMIPFILIIIFIIVVYMGNQSSAYHAVKDPAYSGEKEMEAINQDITFFQEELKKFDESSKEYQDITENLQLASRRIKYLQQKLDAFANKNWKSYYENDLELTGIKLEVVEADMDAYGNELVNVLKLDQEYARYMIDHHLGYDDRFSPSQGVSYTIQVIRSYMPFMLSILLIFITSSIYCCYIDEMDIQYLIPMHPLRKQGSRLFVGVFVGIFIVLIITVLSVLCGYFGNSLGNLYAPVLSYSLHGSTKYISFISIFPQLLLLIFLSILFIVNFVSVISKFARKNITCLIFSLAIITGGIWITMQIVPLYPITHILPTTYLSSFKVLSGELLSITGNANVNFLNGVVVLSLSNVILVMIYNQSSKICSIRGKNND